MRTMYLIGYRNPNPIGKLYGKCYLRYAYSKESALREREALKDIGMVRTWIKRRKIK